MAKPPTASLSVRQAAFIGIGSMVGAGIFSLLGAAGEVAGAAVWLSFLLAGAVALLQGYSFAKFGARYPSAGGFIEYVVRAFGNGHVAGVVAWNVLLANMIITAMVAVSFGSYASGAFAGGDAVWAKVFAVVVILLMAALNTLGSNAVARAQTVVVIVVIGILTIFAVTTIANLHGGYLAPTEYPPFHKIVASIALTFFAFLGFGVVTFTARDLRDPSRELPRALYLALGTATVIYVAVAVGVFGTLTVEEVIASKGTALAVAAEPVLGNAGYLLMTVTALFATAGATNAGLFPVNGLSDEMVAIRQFPAFLARRIGGRVAVALLLTAVVSATLAALFSLSAIASLGSALALLVFSLITAGHLRVRAETGARTSLLVLGLAATVIVLVTFIITTILSEPGTAVAIVALLLVGLLFDYSWKRARDGRSRPAKPDAKWEIAGAPPDDRWYAFDPPAVARDLEVGLDSGLSAAEAEARLQRDGPNELPAEQPPSSVRRFLGQYTSLMQLILVGAAVVSAFIQEWSTAVLLLAITLLNAVVGLRQEGKAESAMNALKSMIKAAARVRRDGRSAQVPAAQVVVGDVVLLTAGDDVPADGRLISASSLQIDESALTGESVPASKDPATLADGELSPADELNMAFMHTPVTHGSGVMIVTATGGKTQVGRIAHMLSTTAREKTPLSREMDRLTLFIIGAAGLTMVVMFILGWQRGESTHALFISAVALAIAAIPEALPTVVQVVLSMGSAELAGQKAIVKDLPSVETLGFTSAINSDKTGTLTMNQMTATQLVGPSDRYVITGTGYALEGDVTHAAGSEIQADAAILPYVVASDAELIDGRVIGDPTEGALLVLAGKAGMDVGSTRERLPRLATLPFDPTYKLMATFNLATDAAGKDVVRCFVKGAAPAVVERVTKALSGGEDVPWNAELREWAEGEEARMEGEGLRVMAAAWRDLDPSTFDAGQDLLAYVRDLELASLVGMVDPPRAESKAAVAAAAAAHVRVRMVTGDDVVTGAAVARQVGIVGEAMLGADFAALSEEERLSRIETIGVVGRVAPEHKVLLAETLKKKGDVVAMTGDGVNDAPAIKAADIGIAMGSGTEVAKNAGRMILSDNNFATIIYAVAQGRKLYDNLSKYVRFVLLLLIAFVLTFLGASLLNIAMGQPFTPAQVLWIHFLVSAPFGVALGFDQATPGLMSMRPRPRGQTMLTRSTLIGCGLVGLFIAASNLLLIQAGITFYGSSQLGASIGLTAWVLMLVVAAYECRSETATVFARETFDSRRMNLIALVEVVGAILITSSDLFGRLLQTKPLTGPQWLLALLAAVALLVAWELGEWIARRRAHAVEHPQPAQRGRRELA